ncbi:MAG: hypothetical protein A4E35_02428 [Methanoregula sp. PtaU1.Bin051]|nr:MAG: hypothetical protein A4E35_02428 [Methanoregula sp. PtaU1.Bin051]
MPDTRYSCIIFIAFFLAAFFLQALTAPVSAADDEIETYLGDTITIRGASYTSDRMYLFFTGPGLPANGVTLTDITQRADQGQFTMVDVADDQTWSYRWDTSRLSSVIDPGTYIVYASTQPVDRSALGGSSTYKTLEVWLKDPHTSKVSISGGTSYTMNPREQPTTSTEEPTPVTPSATLTTEPTTVMTVNTTVLPTITVTPKTALMPVTPLAALLGFMVFGIIMGKCREWEEK